MQLDVGNRLMGRAFRPQRTSPGLALPALRAHAEFELDVVERHARPRTACDGVVTDAMANADDHGVNAGRAGWRKPANDN